MYNVYEITLEQAENIINVEESYLVDVKAIAIKPAKLSETVSAFANAAGGDIYVGISENGGNTRDWLGFQNIEDANSIIHALIEAHSFANHLKFEFLKCFGHIGFVLHIMVSKVQDIVKSCSGEIFIRSNAGKRKLKEAHEINKLKLDKGIVSFEDEWVEVNSKDIENSYSIVNFMINVVPTAEPITYLKNQLLINEEKIKVAGALLFCDEPAIYLPKRCSVKIMRYKTKEEIGREYLNGLPLTTEGDIYNLIFESVKRTKKIIEGIKKLGEKGLEKVIYPDETLHEIITNAILHRDYSIAADVQIRIFDNRVEIESPGKLPGHVTPQNILNNQSARNPKLVRLINKFPNPPNQDVGEGLDTAFRAMEELRLKEPQIVETESSVVVSIFHESLASPEEQVIDYLKNHSEITNSIARDITGIKSENTMKNVFLRLKQRSIIEPVPGRKGSAYAWQKTTSGIIEKYKVINGRLTNIDEAISGLVPNNLNELKVESTEYIPLIFAGIVVSALLGVTVSTGSDITRVLNRHLLPEKDKKFPNNVSRALRDKKLLRQKWLGYEFIDEKRRKRCFYLRKNWESHWSVIFGIAPPKRLVTYINLVAERKQLSIDLE